MKRKLNAIFLYAAVTASLVLAMAAASFSETGSPETELAGITKGIPGNWWQGGWDKLSELQGFISKYPDRHDLCAQAQYRIGNYYQSAGNFNAAIKAYRTVISTYPKIEKECAKAQYETGQVYFYCLSDYGAAVEEYQKVISDYSDGSLKAISQVMTGKAYKELNDPAKAEASFKKVISDYPKGDYDKCEVYMELGSFLIKQCDDSADSKQKISEAIAYYKKAYLLNPNNTAVLEGICDSLTKLDMSSARARQFVKYQKYGPAGEDSVLKTKDDLTNPLDEF